MLRRPLLMLLCLVSMGLPQTIHAQPAARDSLLSREPETPAETFQAVMTMLKLARPQLARQYLDAFMAGDPDDATLLALREQYGTDAFVQLSRVPALQPVGGELLERLNQAALDQLNDPAFQDSIIRGLTGDLRQRTSALGIIRSLDDQAAPLIIRRLGEGTTPEQETHLIEALLSLGRMAIPPLEATLTSSNQRLRTIAADLLGYLKARESIMSLTAVAFDPTASPALQKTARQAVAAIEFGSPERANQVTGLRLTERLRARALEHFSGAFRWETNADGLVPVWTWSDDSGTVVRQLLNPVAASLYTGELLARQALAKAPEDPETQALLLAFLMWRDVRAAGWDQAIPTGPGTAHDLALAVGPELTRRTLNLSLEHSNPAAALVSLQALGLTASRSELVSADSPVLAALHSSEPRLQFAAAEAVLQLDPTEPFPGAGRIVEILARALSATPSRKSVVIDPNTDRGAAIAGMMTTLGFQSGLAPTGRDGFQMAAREGNVELAVLHLNTVQWELSQTVANLRADPRTAGIPIAVYGPPNLRNATARKLRSYRLVSYLDDAGDPGILRSQLEPLLQARSVPELTEEQRRAEIAAAAYWLRHIASGQRTNIFPLESIETALGDAIQRPEIARDVLIALGSIGRPSVQERLAAAGLGRGSDLQTQLAAISQLAFHIQRFGRMIDNKTAQRIGEVHGQTENPQLYSAWSAVIGALKPEPRAGASALLGFPRPAAPVP